MRHTPWHIFVFGSNLAGRHGAGAARIALEQWGAHYGAAIGRMGQAYAIPTKDTHLQPLPLDIIGDYVRSFLIYAQQHPHHTFLVTRIGCGRAGYSPDQIAPLFDVLSAENLVFIPDELGRILR